MTPKPALLLYGATLYDFEHAAVPDAAVLVRDGRIAWMGPEKELPRALAAGSDPVDLRGAALLPGLCDCHVHLGLAAQSCEELELQGVTDRKDLLGQVRRATRGLSPGEWLTGFGWERETVFADGLPQVNELDFTSPAHPIFLASRDGHAAWLNGRALAAVDACGGPPRGGLLHEGEEGRSGLCFEQVFELRRLVVPPLSPQRLEAALVRVMTDLNRQGVVAVHANEGVETYLACRELVAAGRSRVRTLWYFCFRDLEDYLAHKDALAEPGTPWLAPFGVKLFLDGSFGSRTAALSKPYTDGLSGTGVLAMSVEELAAWLRRLEMDGVPVAVHSIGDRATDLLLNEFATLGPLKPLMRRIEHLQLLSEAAVEGPSFEGLLCSMQPQHLFGDRALMRHNLPPELYDRRSYPLATVLRKGGTLLLGSDLPIVPCEVLRGLDAAVGRCAGDGEEAWDPSEAVTLEQALLGHTLNPWRVHGRCFDSGRLRVGGCADLAAFLPDPFLMLHEGPRRLASDVRPVLTVLDGEVVHDAR